MKKLTEEQYAAIRRLTKDQKKSSFDRYLEFYDSLDILYREGMKGAKSQEERDRVHDAWRTLAKMYDSLLMAERRLNGKGEDEL